MMGCADRCDVAASVAAAAMAAEAAWQYACNPETWWTAMTAYGVSHVCRADPQLSPKQQAWQQESLRFHSAIVDIEWVNGEKAELNLRMADTAIADSGAGWSYISSLVVKRLGLGTYPISTAAIYLADGSKMQGPTQGTSASFRFTEGTHEQSPDDQWWHTHRFQIHRSEEGPTIVGNDFWAPRAAVFDYGQQTVTIKTNQGMEQIPFRCKSRSVASVVAAAQPRSGCLKQPPLEQPECIPVRSCKDYYLQPNEGCVVAPTLDTELGTLHRSTSLLLRPRLKHVRDCVDTSRTRGYTCQRLFCTPTALALPQI